MMFFRLSLLTYMIVTLVLYIITFFWVESIRQDSQGGNRRRRPTLDDTATHKTLSIEEEVAPRTTTIVDNDDDDVSLDIDEKESKHRQHPNVLFLILDDLNDYIEMLGGHPQAITPNIKRLMRTSVSFTQAHSNIALCKPSRCSMVNGLYPHTSGYIAADTLPNPQQEYFQHQTTMVEHLKNNGYQTYGTGKIYDGYNEKTIFDEFSQRIDYGPYVYNKTAEKEEESDVVPNNNNNNIAHPWVRRPFRNLGPIRGSFGPLIDLSKIKNGGNDLAWRSGSKMYGYRKFQYVNETNRSLTTDEKSTKWAISKLKELDINNSKPFFLGVGIHRPHHPLVVLQKYFNMYNPLESIELPPSILENDVNDTMRQTLFKKGIGPRMYRDLIKSYGGYRIQALKRYLQAYLASITAADDLIGDILNTLDTSKTLRDNTIVILTSDHGYQIGQKDYLGKNFLWQASTRIPLIIRVPGMTTTTEEEENKEKTNTNFRTCNHPVSLVDLYPTLIDLCNLPKETIKEGNEYSRKLDGHSLKPFLSMDDEKKDKWTGPKFALSALSYELDENEDIDDPIGISLTTRYHDWRYVRYSNGKEELYNTKNDPYEWTNLVVSSNDTTTTENTNEMLIKFRTELFDFVKRTSGSSNKNNDNLLQSDIKKNWIMRETYKVEII